MINYRVILILENDSVRTFYEERNGSSYKRMNGNVPLELRKVAENNESVVKDFRINKLELKLYIK